MFLRHAFAPLIVLLPFAAHAQNGASDNKTIPVRGQCASESHTAAGPVGTDLRRTKFSCNTAILKLTSDRLTILFTTGNGGDRPTLGFAGPRVKGEDDVVIDTVYFQPNQAIAATKGSQCELSFKDNDLTEIYCGAIVDDQQGQRRAMVVSFTAGN